MKTSKSGIVINDISITGYYGYGLRCGYSGGYGYSYIITTTDMDYGRYGASEKVNGCTQRVDYIS